MTEEKKTKGKAWRMREWGRAQYRNRQAKLRMDGESSKTEASKRMLRVQAPKLGKKVDDFMDTFGGSTEHTTPLFLTFVLDMCPYQIASLALQTFLDNLQFNLPVGRMAYKIGKAFENQARWDKALDTMHPSKLDLLAMDDRSKAMKLKQFYDYEDERFTLWDSKCKAGLGAWLLEEIRIETGLWVMDFATGRQKGHKAERYNVPHSSQVNVISPNSARMSAFSDSGSNAMVSALRSRLHRHLNKMGVGGYSVTVSS